MDFQFCDIITNGENMFPGYSFSKLKICFVIFFIFSQINIFSQSAEGKYEYYYLKYQPLPKSYIAFTKAYPDLIFEQSFNTKLHEWEINITTSDNKTGTFFWCKGALLPESELKNKNKYWSLLYRYNKVLQDPAEMTDQQKDALKEFTTSENRRSASGTPMFFFDFLYGSTSRVAIEKQIDVITFLGKRTKVHKRIEEPLKRVEERILLLAERDEAIRAFVENVESADAYNWRIIAGTTRKSFHSVGIAIDILPAKYKNPDGWMLTPLSQRWMPPETVINIFEDEGFIWGGKWAIWDNMHFEYHPELLIE